MSATRRDFLGTTALAGGALGAAALIPGPVAERLAAAALVQRAPTPLRILILGGTGFIGPHQVRYAVARGHKVTLFNRGRTNPGLFKGVSGIEERIGDRAPNPGNYDALKTGEWDVVIDNPTTRPRWVREAAAAVKGRAGQYVFISTISVYAANDTPGADETAAVATTTTPDVESGPEFPPLYGPLKALAEQEAEKAFPGRATIIRPGLIVGVGDATDRFTYWPVRICARRRGAGAAGRRPGADHRRPRSGRVDHPLLRGTRSTGRSTPPARPAASPSARCSRASARRWAPRPPSPTPARRSSRRRSRRCAAGRTCRCGSRPKARPPGSRSAASPRRWPRG